MTDTRAPKSFAVAAKNVTNDKISNNIAGDVKLQKREGSDWKNRKLPWLNET